MPSRPPRSAAYQVTVAERDADNRFLDVAIEEARTGLAEGGVPIGAALVVDGEIVATGRNRRVQLGSVIRHGETDCLENAGRLMGSTRGNWWAVQDLNL